MIHTMIAIATASALVPSPVPAGGSALTLTYETRKVTLTCDPAGGGHPEADRACATLHGIGGNPARLKPAGRYCLMVYQPVTVRLHGSWRGKTVKWKRTYGNSCQMADATGVLFAF